MAEPAGPPPPVPVVRFIYRGETLRNGRVCRLAVDDLTKPVVAGERLLEALRHEDANVDLARFAPFVYSKELEGWVPLRADSEVTLHRAEEDVRGQATQHLKSARPLAVVPLKVPRETARPHTPLAYASRWRAARSSPCSGCSSARAPASRRPR